MGQPTCPECGAGPLVRGTFCRDCGWDGEVMDRVDDRADDGYLDGVDLPQGYGGGEDDFDYEAVLRREGLLGGDGDEPARRPPDVVSGAATVHLLVAGVVLAFVVIVALLSFR